MECPKHLFAKILCHGKTSLFSWQIINYPPPLPFPHISHIFYSSKHPETPYLQGFKRKTTKKKKRTVFSYNKKNCQKNNSCVNTPYSKTS